LQETVDGYFISTVFVGCNVRFETMVFRPDDDAVWQARSNTKAEALADHERALRAGDNLALFPGPAYRSRPRRHLKIRKPRSIGTIGLPSDGRWQNAPGSSSKNFHIGLARGAILGFLISTDRIL
jgi:hypothetical protein